MRRYASIAGLATTLPIAATLAPAARAEDPHTAKGDEARNRLGLAVGVATGAGPNKATTIAFSPRANYHYEVSRGWEFGADLDLWAPRLSALALLADSRLYAALGEHAEWGLSAKLGPLFEWQGSGRFYGAAIGAGADVRIWWSRALGVELAADGVAGFATRRPRGEDVDNTTGLLALTARAGAVARF